MHSFFHTKPLKPSAPFVLTAHLSLEQPYFKGSRTHVPVVLTARVYRFPQIRTGTRAKIDRKLFTPFPPPASKQMGLFPPLHILHVPLPPRLPLGLKQVRVAEHTGLTWHAGMPGETWSPSSLSMLTLLLEGIPSRIRYYPSQKPEPALNGPVCGGGSFKLTFIIIADAVLSSFQVYRFDSSIPYSILAVVSLVTIRCPDHVSYAVLSSSVTYFITGHLHLLLTPFTYFTHPNTPPL